MLIDVFQEMEKVKNRVNRYLSGVSNRCDYPLLNVWRNDNGLIIKVELPGVEEADIDLSIVKEVLTIKAIRKELELLENEQYLKRERDCGSISRSLKLPYRVEIDNVEASLKNGILTITLPRAEADKPKKIVIKAAK